MQSISFLKRLMHPMDTYVVVDQRIWTVFISPVLISHAREFLMSGVSLLL